MSLVGVYNTEWRKRKINLFSVIRSFVSQLSPGQELTKVSLPSELCHPFSMLELVAFRELQLFHILFEVNSANTPLERFLAILRWYLGLVREETMEKKPFNPVIGETHLCWVDHSNSGDYSEFIGEQVSHHPPVSAFIVRNKQQNLSITGAVTFKVGFGSNCASVTTGGEVTIHTSNEKYTMTKCVPDMMVNNVIWGDKYLMWHGGVTITCSDNKYVANIKFSELDGRNLLEGVISEGDVPLFKLDGFAGEKSYITDLTKTTEEKKLLADISTYEDNKIFYLPEEVQTAYNSLKLWMPVKEAIIKNDMATADEQKKKIEADQRVRQKQRLSSGAWRETQYFSFHSKPIPTNNSTNNANTGDTGTGGASPSPSPEPHTSTNDNEGDAPHEDDPNANPHNLEEELSRGTWEFKNNFSIDQEYITSMLQEAEQIRSKREAEKTPNETDEGDDGPQDANPDTGSTCSVQ